ncbi:hypothetical protein HHA02_02320 [Cobetia marina]|nr:hypothetical protein HHA02_02320 [Cobetia marina]
MLTIQYVKRVQAIDSLLFARMRGCLHKPGTSTCRNGGWADRRIVWGDGHWRESHLSDTDTIQLIVACIAKGDLESLVN